MAMKFFFMILPLVLLGFSSCDNDSSSSSSITQGSIDPRFQPFVNEFISEASQRGVSLNSNRLFSLVVKFGALDANTLGTCTSGGNTNEITINNQIADNQIRWVVIHELGHCLLRMEHRNDVLSIMNSVLRQRQLDAWSSKAAFDEFFQPRFFEAF